MKRAPNRDILWLFLVTRLILVVVTYFGYILFTQDKYSNTPVSITTFLSTWNHWDAKRYLNIAQFGYHLQTHDQAFFPLFPLLISAFAHLFGDWSYLLVGMVLSNAALLGALFLLYHLATDCGGEQVARRTLLYLCIFPTAFFFFAAYNESLFLLLTTATFLALRHQRWGVAGLLGLLAALTRTTGVLLAIPYLYELWIAREQVLATQRTLLRALVPILLIPTGILLYCIYCWRTTGNPLVFAAQQVYWARQLNWPWVGIWQGFVEFFWHQPFGSFYQVHVLLDLSATVSFIVLAIVGIHKLRTSYSLWTGLLLLSTLLSSTLGQPDSLTSNQRLVLEIFPAFISLALVGIRHPRFHQIILWLLPALLATLSLIFIMGKWMV